MNPHANGVAQGNQQPQMLSLVRLSADSDVGLMNIGMAGKVTQAPDGNRVEVILMISLAQPSPIDGRLHIEHIPYRIVGVAEASDLIAKFLEQKAAAQAPSLLIPA